MVCCSTSESASYEKGQHLEVTFPYSNMTGALNQGRLAEIPCRSPARREGTVLPFTSTSLTRRATESVAPATIGTYSTAAARAAKESVVLAVESRAAWRRIHAQSSWNRMKPSSSSLPARKRWKFYAPARPRLLSRATSNRKRCRVTGSALSLKQNERLQSVPVVSMTRSARRLTTPLAIGLGAVVCMAKPFKPLTGKKKRLAAGGAPGGPTSGSEDIWITPG